MHSGRPSVRGGVWDTMSIVIRRIIARVVILALALTLAFPATPVREASAASQAQDLGLDPEYIPADVGQTALDVYVSATGHSVRGMMLDYWRANGAASVYGNPISEPFGAANGLYSQAFERGVFQWNPEWSWTDDPAVRLMPIGTQEVKETRLGTRADGRRTGADRRAGAWRPGSESQARAAEVANAGGRFSDVTGYSIAGEFGAWYDSHEGWFYLGAPISEPHRERGMMVQYFENAVLLSINGVAAPAPLPREKPSAYGFETTPVPQDGRPEFSEALFYENPNPYGVDPTGLPGRKRIVVSISQQTMTVYQGDQIVLQSLVSTGLAPNNTEIGVFHVRLKYETQDMAGFTDATGEVVGFEDSGTQTANRYEMKDVPDVMYFNFDAEALHGTYWHNNFGQRMSHGCVNLPLDVAAFMYDFAPLGTEVTVVE